MKKIATKNTTNNDKLLLQEKEGLPRCLGLLLLLKSRRFCCRDDVNDDKKIDKKTTIPLYFLCGKGGACTPAQHYQSPSERDQILLFDPLDLYHSRAVLFCFMNAKPNSRKKKKTKSKKRNERGRLGWTGLVFSSSSKPRNESGGV